MGISIFGTKAAREPLHLTPNTEKTLSKTAQSRGPYLDIDVYRY